MKKLTAWFLLIILVLQLVSFFAFADSSEYNYHATIEVKNYGKIVVELYPNIAPATVENFVNLAGQGFYDGLTFHRIISGFMIQGGDPLGNGMGGSKKKINGEFSANGFENTLSHTRGVLSMARASAYNSATSQFFIMHQDATYLDGQYAAFGRVISGMEIVDAICRKTPTTDANGTVAKENQPVITSITVTKNQISITEEETVCTNDYEYKVLNDGTIAIVKYTGTAAILTIPTHLNGLRVTEIGDYAFINCSSLYRVTIPDSIVAIGANPFRGCHLSFIDISPDHPTLALIDGVLFYKPTKRLVSYPCNASDASYTIPYGIKEIGSAAFCENNSLEKIVTPSSVTVIGDRAFEYCENLISVVIPESVTSIGASAFYKCENLKSITIPNSVIEIMDYTFSFCKNLSELILSNSIKSIGRRAFTYCIALKELTVPNSITYIDETAFDACYPLFIVERNSYARQYAIDNGLNYNYPDANDWLLQ